MSEWFFIDENSEFAKWKQFKALDVSFTAPPLPDVVVVWRCRECQWYVSASAPSADAVKCPECGSEKK